MATKKSKAILNDSPLKSPVELIVTACVLANANALVVGAAGGGKTALLKWSAVQVLGGNESELKFFEMSESARREDISGVSNPLFRLTPDAEAQGIEPWLVENTMLDPRFKIVLVDELTRGSSMAFSEMIHRMHSETSGDKKPVLATANWLKVEEKTVPLFDRFASVTFVQDEELDVEQFFHNASPRYWDYRVPSWEKALEVRGHVEAYLELADKTAHPSTSVVKDLIDSIITGVRTANSLDSGVKLTLNYRRLQDLMKIAYATGVYYSDDPEFTELHPKVYETIALCYPATDVDEQRVWREVCEGLIDDAAVSLEAYMAEAHGIAKEVIAEGGAPEQVLERLASFIEDAKDALKIAGHSGKDVKEAIAKLEKYTRDLYTGKIKI